VQAVAHRTRERTTELRDEDAIWKLLGRIEALARIHDDGSEGYAKIRQAIEEFDKAREDQ